MSTSITHHFRPNARGSTPYPVGHSRWAVLATSISLPLPSYQTTITSTEESKQPLSHHLPGAKCMYCTIFLAPICSILLQHTPCYRIVDLTSSVSALPRYGSGENLSRTKGKFSFCAKPWEENQKVHTEQQSGISSKGYNDGLRSNLKIAQGTIWLS